VEIKYQGYENFAFDELFAEGFTEKDIITSKKNVPEIWYTNNDKNHRYFVDILKALGHIKKITR
jgi:hypothetical protein